MSVGRSAIDSDCVFPNHRAMRHTIFLLLLSGLILFVTGCATASGPELGMTPNGKLSPCPASPNCVSSDAADDGHAIAPLAIIGAPDAAWQALIAHIESQPRFDIRERKPDYLRAEARTRLLRFVDDVEFSLRVGEKQIAMRSASRVGYSDLGTNRRRLESIRQSLAAAGVVEGAD